MFEEMIKRTTSENIIDFVKNGEECTPREKISAEKRVNDAEFSVMEMVEKKFPDFEEHNAITEIINAAIAEIEEVYFEIGFKAGATTLFNILGK